MGLILIIDFLAAMLIGGGCAYVLVEKSVLPMLRIFRAFRAFRSLWWRVRP